MLHKNHTTKILLCVSIILTSQFSILNSLRAQKPVIPDTASAGQLRVDEVMSLIDGNYVDAPDMDRMGEEAIKAMLKALDPHSMYIPAKDVQRANEGLEGNFEGVGISFQIIDDTIVVGSVIDGGPSEKVGIMVGDKLIRIDGSPATGDSINNNFVFKHLRGKKGTVVSIDILRQGTVYNFEITRDKVPIYSIDTYFMADDTIGYIRLVRFARTSVDEFRKALKSLKKQGMTALILDLRGNTGGYLDIAYGMANEFLSRGQLIVYTEGRRSPRQDFRANSRGNFRDGRLAVLIDEGSASASEILSGAIQDWDRGIVIGRRSFGKGLVQRMMQLKDGGQVRLTTARYYTPSGRCIQRPYDGGSDAYRDDLSQRYKHGELVNADSIHFADSLRYRTAHGRTVYGGGGIMPDCFVPLDTTKYAKCYRELSAKSIIINANLRYMDKNRKKLAKTYTSFEKFKAEYEVPQDLIDNIFAEGEKQDIRPKDDEERQKATENIRLIIKGLVARDLWDMSEYFSIIYENDEVVRKAVELLSQQ